MDALMPHNFTTGEPYSGTNVSRLVAAQHAAGYPTPEWAGYGQARKAGYQVQKGEKCTRIARVVPVKDRDTGREKRTLTYRRVFNIAQMAPIDGASCDKNAT
jgi:antirestriction protein ArdC